MRGVARDEHLHAGVLALSVGTVGQHGRLPGGKQSARVVGDRGVGPGRSERTVDRVLPDDQPAPDPTLVGVCDHGGDGGRAVRRDVVGDRLQLGKRVAGHRLGEDVDDSAAGEADGERVVVGHSVALQFRRPDATTSLASS